MKEKKFVSLRAKLLIQNPGLSFSFIFRCTVVDQRQAPCTPIEVYLCVAFSSHHRYPSPSGKGCYSFITAWMATKSMTFGSVLIDILDTEAILSPFSQTSSRSSSHTPHSIFVSPAWASLELCGKLFDKLASNWGSV